MKNPLLVLLAIVVLAMQIAGFIFLDTATGPYSSESARKPALAAGLTCLGLGSGLLVLGLFLLRRKD